VTNQSQSLGLGQVFGLPRIEQVVDDGIEALFRWGPGLGQVVIEVCDVDRFDRRLDIGIGGQQYATGERKELARLRQQIGALHARHTLVADDDGQRVAG
jgi:hypothetical protein